jgi:hypothetical protein
MDDRLRVSSLYTLSTHPHLTLAQINENNRHVLFPAESYNSPSVHEILYRIQRECKTTILDSDEVFRLLRNSFELYFERSVLYSIERAPEIWGNKLAHLRSQKMTVSSGFGAIYLLRLIVFLAVGTDNIANTSEVETSESLTDKDLIGIAEAEQSSLAGGVSQMSQISQSRRRNLNARQLAGAANKLLDVIQYIIRDLEKNSHFLFQ